MKINRTSVAVAGIALTISGTSLAESFMGLEVTKQRFSIAGGQAVELPVTVRGPIPARANGVIVEAAGPLFGPSRTEAGKLAMIWAFSITVPSGTTYESVTINEVSGEQSTPVVSEGKVVPETMRAPDGQELHILQLRGGPSTVAPETTPWIYQDGTATFIYRVDLKNSSGETFSLYQPTTFGDGAKSKIRQMVARAAASQSRLNPMHWPNYTVQPTPRSGAADLVRSAARTWSVG